MFFLSPKSNNCLLSVGCPPKLIIFGCMGTVMLGLRKRLSKYANRYPKFRRYLIGDPQGGGVERKRQCREGENLLVGCFVVEGNMGVYSACSRLTEEDSLRPPSGGEGGFLNKRQVLSFFPSIGPVPTFVRSRTSIHTKVHTEIV